MKGTSLIVSIVLAVAVLVLYILHFTGGNTILDVSGDSPVSERTDGLKIAYIKSDSLIMNYDYAEVLHDEFMKKQEAFTQEYGSKRQTFEREAAEFQQKLQRGGFLTEQRAIQERDRLVGREQEIVKLDQDLSTRLAEMQAANNQMIIDSLLNYLKIFNAGKNYDFILNAGDVLIGPESDNITSQVLQAMNARYQASQTKK
ncbi:MAG: OmpH family outer membrane protein [Bacteroidota bacterium]